MTLLDETEARREIAAIEDEPCGAMRKARRLLALSRRIRSAQSELKRSMQAPDCDEASAAAQEMRVQLRSLRRLDDDVRVRASKALRSLRKIRLGFGYGPQVSPKLFGLRSRRRSV